MLWNYDDSWREKFETCEHRDILIVPHGTNVKKVSRKPPEVTNKVPKLDENDDPIPGEFRPIEFVITNDDIYKEKFEYTNSLDTNEDLAFCGCESAMVKFTIRNNKTYDEETGRWVPDVPNLQNYVITDENGNTIVGEVQTHYIIKVYMYFNGDSDSLVYLGMFVVEEDKVSSDGYTRDITAFDFLYTIRDMDIHNWYVHLFRGVSYKTDDFVKYFENRKLKVPEGYTPETYYNEGWIREPPENGYWLLKDMLQDLIKNIATRYPDQKTVTNRENKKENRTDDTSEGKTKQISNYYTNDAEPYVGLALPMVLDPDLFDNTKEYNIPETPGENAHECYGHMDIMNLKVYEDPKIMDAGALSAGKFLEDIGALAGRYPYIRLDDIEDDDYHALAEWDPENPDAWYPYNLYEKCILTFKPLPKNDSKIVADNYFDNHDIAKGFKHDQYAVGTIHIWELYTRFDDSDKPMFSYANLTKEQNKQKELNPGSLKKIQMSNNMFIDYLANKEDDVKYAKDDENQKDKNILLARYNRVRNLLMYGEDTDGEPQDKNQKNGLLHQGYADIKYRTYTPYELTTFADPVREVGDRIKVHFEDKITGETFDFDTYILSRKISGIQKMMDTYVAKGATANVTFSNYKTGTTYAPMTMGYYGGGSSGSSSGGGTTFTGLTKDDFVEIIRNIGFRLLDEPTSVMARFVATSTSESSDVTLYETSYPLQTGESDIHDGDTTNPIYVYDWGNEELKEYNVSAGDYWTVLYRDGDGIEYPEHTDSPLYLYDGSKWIYVGDTGPYFTGTNNTISAAGRNESGNITISEIENGKLTIGSNVNKLTLGTFYPDDEDHPEAGGRFNEDYILREQIESTKYYHYTFETSYSSGLLTPPQSFNVNYGDVIHYDNDQGIIPDVDASCILYYQYPGIWLDVSNDRGVPVRHIDYTVKPHVELKWSDPDNINSWEPKPCAWEGTVIIRKRNSAPLHRWDGELIVDSTTKDAYKDTAFIDDTIELNRTYYYGFFPYYTAYTEDGHAIKYYRFTKTIRVSTGTTIDAPEIISIERIS